jgi:hypothetical protein
MLPFGNPITLYIGAAAVVASGIGGYTVRGWQCDAAYAKALEAAQEERERMQDEIDEKGRDFEAARNQADALAAARGTDIRTIYRNVPAPPISCAADPSIVGVLQSGVDSANAAASGKSGGALQVTSKSSDASDRSREGDLGEPVDSEIYGMQR